MLLKVPIGKVLNELSLLLLQNNIINPHILQGARTHVERYIKYGKRDGLKGPVL